MKYIQRNQRCLKCLCIVLTITVPITIISFVFLLIFKSNPCTLESSFANFCNGKCCESSCIAISICRETNDLYIDIPLTIFSVIGFFAITSIFLCCFCRCKTQNMPPLLQLQRIVQMKKLMRNKKDQNQGLQLVNQVDSQMNVQQAIYYHGTKVGNYGSRKSQSSFSQHNYQNQPPVYNNYNNNFNYGPPLNNQQRNNNQNCYFPNNNSPHFSNI